MNRVKGKNQMIVSLDAEKTFDQKKRTPLHDKNPGEIRDIRNIPQHNKGSLRKAHSQLNKEKLKEILKQFRTRQECTLFYTYLIQSLKS